MKKVIFDVYSVMYFYATYIDEMDKKDLAESISSEFFDYGEYNSIYDELELEVPKPKKIRDILLGATALVIIKYLKSKI